MFAIFSPLSMFAVNAPRGASPVKLLIVVGAAWAVMVIAVAAGAARVGLRRATGIGASFLLVFFSWRAIVDLSSRLSLPAMVAEWIVPLLLFALLGWAAVRFGNTQGYRTVMVVVGIALVATPVPSFIAWYATTPVSLGDHLVAPSAATGERPDVYLIVLDGYGRSDVLEELYGFDNGAFLNALEVEGFTVPSRSTANYSMTAASVASALSMDYLVAPGRVPDHRLRLALYDVIRGDNPVAHTMLKSGYLYTHIESGWDGSRCGPAVDRCHEAGLLDEASWTLLNRTPLAVPLENAVGHAFAWNGLRALDDLNRVAGERSGDPQFVFAHVLLPHPPLNLDAECRVRPEPQPGGGAVGARFLVGTPELDARKEAYVDQIRCVNTKILRFLDELGDDSVVLLTGDHGPDSFGQVSVAPDDWTAEDSFERFSVFSAYRLTERCATVEPDTDLINGVRSLVSCVTGDGIDHLPRRTLIFPTPDGDPNPTTQVDIVTHQSDG
jgi:hypothetical protein